MTKTQASITVGKDFIRGKAAHNYHIVHHVLIYHEIYFNGEETRVKDYSGSGHFHAIKWIREFHKFFNKNFYRGETSWLLYSDNQHFPPKRPSKKCLTNKWVCKQELNKYHLLQRRRRRQGRERDSDNNS